jgi:pyrroline-5-carboxylate reductase
LADGVPYDKPIRLTPRDFPPVTDSASAPLIAFIGGGNMAASLIGGLLRGGMPAARISVAEPLAARRDWLVQTYAVTACADGAEAARDADALVLAVKPQQMQEALAGLQPRPGAVVVSIAAGVRLATLTQALGRQIHPVRSMPNTPALLGKGITGLYAPPETPAAARALAESLLGTAGPTVWVTAESDLDAVTALSGSGPAYYFLLTEALAEAGAQLGLDADTARALAHQTLIGAAAMAEQTGADIHDLRVQVTSKGGTTEAAVAHLESAGLRTILADALRAACLRSQQLGASLATPNAKDL